MKKYFSIILLLVATLTLAAQGISTKIMVVYKNDGTRDTLLWDRSGGSYFYGVEHPVENSYITGTWDVRYGGIEWAISLTRDGNHAPFELYGFMISSKTGDTIPDYNYSGWTDASYSDGPLYLADKNKWFFNRQTGYIGSRVQYASTEIFDSLVLGTEYYGRAFYRLDGKTYFSSETKIRVPKTKSLVQSRFYAKYTTVGEDVLVNIQNVNITNETTNAAKEISREFIVGVLSKMSAEELHNMASIQEECDDGTLYVIEQVSDAVVNQASETLKANALSSFYVNASLDNLVMKGNNRNEKFYTDTASFKPVVVECSESWGIPGNRYISTDLKTERTTPRMCFALDHLMLPGQKYEITLTFAPNTEDIEADTLSTYFRIQMADGTGANMYNDAFPSSGTYLPGDTIISNKGAFVAKPKIVNTFTMRYTPQRLAYCHALQIEHVYNFSIIASNRSKYGQRLRFAGIEVKAVEPAQATRRQSTPQDAE